VDMDSSLAFASPVITRYPLDVTTGWAAFPVYTSSFNGWVDWSNVSKVSC